MMNSTDNADETVHVASCNGQHQIITGAKQKDSELSSKTGRKSSIAAEASKCHIEAGASASVELIIIP